MESNNSTLNTFFTTERKKKIIFGSVVADIGGRHSEYENWVEANRTSYKVSSMTTSALDNYIGKTPLTIANESATYSRRYITPS